MFDLKVFKEKAQKHSLIPQALLTKFYFAGEAHRLSNSYTDPNYTPFFVLLGQQVKAKKVAHFGLYDGVIGSCFLEGCQSVEHYFGYDTEQKGHTYRLAKRNITSVIKKTFSVYTGAIDDEFLKHFLSQKWDCVLITGDYDTTLCSKILNLSWPQMESGGTIICDRIASNENMSKAFSTFCKLSNRKEVRLNSRYGTGLIER